MGVIYHYTSYTSAIDIILQDTLKSLGTYESKKKINGKYQFGISFTRDKYFHKKDRYIGGIDVKFVIDGDKLSNNYKLIPYSDGWGNESETFLVLPNVQKGIQNILQYINHIEVYNNNWNDFENNIHDSKRWKGFNRYTDNFIDYDSYIKYLINISGKDVKHA